MFRGKPYSSTNAHFSKLKTNKTARIRAETWMFWLPFKVYGAVTTFEKIKYKKILFK